MPLFCGNRIIRGPYVNRLSRHILTACWRLRYSTILLTTAPLHLRGIGFLHIQDGLLSEEDEELPLARHVVGTLQQFYFVEDFVLIVFVGAEKVVVSDPECQVVVGAVDAVKTVCRAIGSFIGAVEPFDHLFERAVFCGDSIAVGKSDDLCNFESKGISELFREFHCGEGIGAVTVSDELKFFRQLCKVAEGHAHGEDAGSDAPVVRYLIADDGACGGIHDEPDVGFDAAYLYVRFICGKNLSLFVGILVDKGFDADGGSLAVVGDLLVGDGDVVEILEGL